MAYSSDLFRQTDPQGYSTVGGKGGLAQYLVPAGTGAVDVLNEYSWTITEKNGREETPSAVLTEFRLLQSALMNSARYYATGLGQQIISTKNPYLPGMQGYAGLFDFNNPTGFWYQVPYFSEVNSEVSNTWVTLDILEKIKNAATELGLGATARFGENVVNAALLGYEMNYPRVGVMDRPKLWESSTFRTINIKFPLFNTVKVEDIKKNWDLCYLLMYQNMFNKRDFITAIPPVFYTVFVPGQFFSIAMYVSDLKIYNRGNMRKLYLDGTLKNVPDVYEVDMTLTDMVMPSQNMYAELLKNEPIKVALKDKDGKYYSPLNPDLITKENIGETFKKGVEGAANTAKEGVNFLKNIAGF